MPLWVLAVAASALADALEALADSLAVLADSLAALAEALEALAEALEALADALDAEALDEAADEELELPQAARASIDSAKANAHAIAKTWGLLKIVFLIEQSLPDSRLVR